MTTADLLYVAGFLLEVTALVLLALFTAFLLVVAAIWGAIWVWEHTPWCRRRDAALQAHIDQALAAAAPPTTDEVLAAYERELTDLRPPSALAEFYIQPEDFR